MSNVTPGTCLCAAMMTHPASQAVAKKACQTWSPIKRAPIRARFWLIHLVRSDIVAATRKVTPTATRRGTTMASQE